MGLGALQQNVNCLKKEKVFQTSSCHKIWGGGGWNRLDFSSRLVQHSSVHFSAIQWNWWKLHRWQQRQTSCVMRSGEWRKPSRSGQPSSVLGRPTSYHYIFTPWCGVLYFQAENSEKRAKLREVEAVVAKVHVHLVPRPPTLYLPVYVTLLYTWKQNSDVLFTL